MTPPTNPEGTLRQANPAALSWLMQRDGSGTEGNEYDNQAARDSDAARLQEMAMLDNDAPQASRKVCNGG